MPLDSYASSCAQQSEKAGIIIKHFESGYDIQRLKFWSLSRYGLVNDTVRQMPDLMNHPQARQIELDVRRMGSMIPKNLSSEENEYLVTETKRLALSILAEYPNLHYYQGFHDVCYTFLSVLGPDEAFAVLKQLVPKHFNVFMQETMDATSETLQLVFDLLQLTSPEIWFRFRALNFEPFFTLSWFLTWFTHILSDSNDIHRLYDLFIAFEPSMLIYLSVSVIICSTEEISSTSDDFGELHHALTHLPMKHDVEKLIQCALDIYLKIRPERLLKKAEDRRAVGRTIKKPSASSLTLGFVNQSLLVYGAIAVLTKMRAYAYILTVWFLGVQCVAIIGPGGSSFSLVASWSDADLAAFADVNTDRRTDAIVLSSSESALYALLAPNAKQTDGKPERKKLISLTHSLPLRSIAVADFDGDSVADFLLVFRDTSKYSVNVWYGGKNVTRSVGSFATQPLVCDVNADMIADVYGEMENHRVVALGEPNAFSLQNFTHSATSLSELSSAGFVSLAFNPNPSLVALAVDTIEVFNDLTPKGDGSPSSYPLPIELKGANRPIGKLVFGDFDMSGRIQLLIAGCSDNTCRHSYIFMHSLTGNAVWEAIAVEWNPPDMEGSCSLAPASVDQFSSAAIIGLSLGDADLDGYPDLAVGLKCTRTSGLRPIILPAILRNLAGAGGKVRFQAYLLPGVESQETLKQIAFYDYNEDGILDLYMSYEGRGGVSTSLYMQKLTKEAYFLKPYFKVMLTTGRCGSPSQCPDGVLPYGLPGYGFRASYETQGADGGRIRSSAVFVTSSCCGALQLPFTTFGFGDFATYIENVPVSVPAPTQQARKHKLTFIVPNAQVVVVPYPPDNPSNWQAKLFLQPLYDMKVIYVAITLLVTCIVLLVVVAILQYLEVRSDQKERMQESQRFHFDAM
ncbi:T-cell immunomodulatory protein [Echinococcus granulosus]|uniref:T-cell immunomodulatory protein n=1 Tax=Echinococcus granulosus TaxID=6210 RepID=W6V8B8_ECHGR|nr:T-cell immunomodulatory protein [Echinococcus granulosus]EUB62759.1 T-cell immunomodulatory protein [Echinococcus granulosus]